MSQIQIILPEDTTKKLKILAAKADRSLKKFIPLYLNHAVDLNIIDIDERTGAFINSTLSQSQSQSSSLTIEQLQAAGIKDVKLNKPGSELTPEEQLLEQQKINLQQDKVLKQREKKWFKRAQEVMEDYWDDEQCQYFAHVHIYGNDIYLSNPDDSAAVHPEPDDSRLEDLLKTEKSYYTGSTADTSDLWDGYYDELQDLIKEPYPNKYYEKIVNYCINNSLYSELKDILSYPSSDNLKYNHDDTLLAALETPAGYEWTDGEWDEIANYLK